MSFKSLEDRFNEKVNTLYAGAKTKFDNGRPSNGANDDPLIVRSPGNGYWNRAESRATPISSTVQDVKRLTLFTLSTRGIAFLAKQQLLQTGNTFELTRVINPAFVVANAVPFLHVKRNLRPIGDLLKRTDTSYDNVRKLGQLQVKTYDSAVAKWKVPSYILNAEGSSDNNKRGNIFSRIGNAIKSYGDTILKDFGSIVNAKRNVGDKFGYNATGWQKSRPELATGNIVETITAKNREYVQSTVNRFDVEREKERPKVLSSGNPVYATYKGTQFIKYFNAGNVGIASANADEVLNGKTNMQARVNAFKSGPNATRKISYIKDESNLPAAFTNLYVKTEAYNSINNNFDDPIVVSFAMGNEGHIRFRAFIKDLNENVNPQYTPLQYIGRIEKFINYTGVQRDISFKLAVLAFSQDELEGVWRKINYLTGMAFPYGFNKGILQPNIVRLTIGDVYVNQPGYITTLNKNFNEPAESWEIDSGKQVPIGATMDMKFTLIEKATRIAESPFHYITETMDGFYPTIDVAKTLNSLDPTKAPSVAPITTSVNTRITPASQTRPSSPSSTDPLFKLPSGFSTNNTTTNNPFTRSSTSPFRGFGGGGGFAGGGGGSTF